MLKRDDLMKRSKSLVLIIIGLTMFIKGIFYICHSHFFVWPPAWQLYENDHIVGFLFILSGVALICMEIWSKQTPMILKSIIYGVCLFLMTAISVLEWCHFIFLGMPMSAITNTCITFILLVYAIAGDARA